MKWALTNTEPLTTESERAVVSADGRRGLIRVRHQGGRPDVYGFVRDDAGKVLDSCPILVSSYELLDKE